MTQRLSRGSRLSLVRDERGGEKEGGNEEREEYLGKMRFLQHMKGVFTEVLTSYE